jgi:outer membrane protein assembly factor BamE (lipoprotein component of BamABCDE complex)
MGRAPPCFNRTEAITSVPRHASRQTRLSASLLVTLATFGLVGCGGSVDQRGHLPEAEKIAQIRPGTTTRSEVASILGTPSSIGVFNDNNWYYISRKTRQVAFFKPDVLDQQVYVVSFDPSGVVQSIDHKSLQDGREITPVPGATPTPGRELTFLEQVLGNVGRFTGGRSAGIDDEARPPGPSPRD